ncbi:MAG TPA: OmpA family protein [Deltaproteobacteria bacterium]|nr:OmpA family protein [Deltaproteobacteria bacterium]HOI08596.1 OmpA family protein [Deltaproteobacteria bacterium]
MIRKALQMLLILTVFLASGCAHKYSEAEYQAVVSQAKSCAETTQKMKEESEGRAKRAEELQKKLDQTSRELAKALIEKQELLDRNIQCLEEKKVLIRQLSQSSTMSQEKKESQQRVTRGYEYIMSLLEAERSGDQLYVIRGQDKIKIVIPQKSLFPTPGSAWLTPKGTKLIKKVSAGIKHLNPSSVEVAGHTDKTYIADQKPAAYSSNWHLALARALAVLQTLEELHVKRDSLSASSYGDTKPIADITSEAGKAMNRRVEIVITP